MKMVNSQFSIQLLYAFIQTRGQKDLVIETGEGLSPGQDLLVDKIDHTPIYQRHPSGTTTRKTEGSFVILLVVVCTFILAFRWNVNVLVVP